MKEENIDPAAVVARTQERARAHTRGPGPRDEARRDASFSGREPLPRKGMKSSYGVASLCQSIPRVLMPAFHEFCLPSGDSSSIQRGRGSFFPQPGGATVIEK